MNKENLMKLFKYYKKRYKLKTKLVIQELGDDDGKFNLDNNKITLFKKSKISNHLINTKKIKELLIHLAWGNEKFSFKNRGQIYSFVLLHELRHAIDYTKGYMTSNNFVNKYDYFQNRADKFALKMIEKRGIND
jgi:hypothetical protein